MIFVDTGGWVARFDLQDKFHPQAVAAYDLIVRGEFGRMITSDYVLNETYTLLRMHIGIGGVREFRDLIQLSRNVEVLHVTPEDFEGSLDLMLRHGDKRWSLTDCSSFRFMREMQIRSAFAFDKNFREAGFELHPS